MVLKMGRLILSFQSNELYGIEKDMFDIILRKKITSRKEIRDILSLLPDRTREIVRKLVKKELVYTLHGLVILNE